jgi:PAS domain S-box-containing protein
MSDISTPVTVLHVGDTPGTVTETADALERADDRFVVETATDPREGLERLGTRDVDCVVSDYAMSGMDGIELLEAVRADDPDLPFVLFTGEGCEAVASEAVAAGATDYIRNGGDADGYELLANSVRTAVEGYRAAERAATLERIRALVREVNHVLVRASSRDDLEERVCRAISRTEPYRFAWIGEYDPGTDRVTPRAWAGLEDGYLDDITVTADRTSTGRGPTGTALSERRIAVAQNIQNDPEFAPWREDAVERGYLSSAAVPLVREGTLYGVLNVYADRTYAFDDRERDLFAELGDDIAHAIQAMATRTALRTEKERFQHLVTQVREYAIFRLDPDGYVRSWNEGARRLNGYTRDEIVGEHVSVFYPEDADGSQPADVLRAAAERGSYEEEGWRVRDDGTRFWAQVTVTALRDDEGELEGFSKVVRDMTERREREQELARFREAVEAAGHAVYITTTDGVIEYVNPAFETITGYSHGEAVGRTPRILNSGEMEDGYYERLWTTVLDGGTWEEEIVDQRADGTRYHAHQTIAPILDEDEIREFVAIQTDITERKERERQLRVLGRVLRHNLRNDLNVVSGIAESIRDDYPDALDRETTTLIETCRQLLGIVRKEREITEVLTGDLGRERVDVATLVREAVAAFDERYPDATLAVTCAGPVSLTTTTRLQRALFELLENAVVHNDRDAPSVAVTVSHGDDGVCIEIADDGPGIPEMERAVLLGEEAIRPLYHGSGLGLWLVYWIVDRADGTLHFEGNEPRGSIVRIELPDDGVPTT